MSRWDIVFSPRVCYWVLCGLVAALFLMGGGSRYDIMSLPALRPLTCLALGYGLIATRWNDLARLGMPFWLVMAMLTLAGVQLLPLPFEVWSKFPGREPVLQISATLGFADHWRPLSLAPSRTWNTLFALVAPLACLVLLRTQVEAPRMRLLWPLLAAGAATALLGLLQVLGPNEGPFYLYKITNWGLAVGLFANRNHQAIFLASLIPLIAFAAMRARQENMATQSVTTVAAFGAILFVIPLILVTGSRAGTALGLGAILVVAALFWFHRRLGPGKDKATRKDLSRFVPYLLLAGVVVIVAITYALSRSLAFDRMSGPLDGGLRGDLVPVLVDMVQTYFPVGSGLGSFYLAYKIAEPTELLQPTYLNQAHNDYLQLLIEGGLPGAIIMLLAAWWFVREGVRAARRFFRAAGQNTVDITAFAWLSLAILLAGSMLDYPLRTPALMGQAAILAFIIGRAVPNRNKRAGDQGVDGGSRSDKPPVQPRVIRGGD